MFTNFERYLPTKPFRKVIIIDSPQKGENINEVPISDYLKNLQLDIEIFNSSNTGSLAEVKKYIEDQVKTKKLNEIIIHFGMHGNEEGLCFSEDNLYWKDLGVWLDSVNKSIGFLEFPFGALPVSKISLCFNSCSGHYAKVLKKNNTLSYKFLIGSKNPMFWDEGIIGFITFYHHLLYRELSISYSLERMNSSIGNNVFFLDISHSFLLYQYRVLKLKEKIKKVFNSLSV